MPSLRHMLLALFLLVGSGRAPAQPTNLAYKPAADAPPRICNPTVAVDVLTHRFNNARTGANLQETCLTPANVSATTFGKLFTLAVRGQVYAQPLVVTNLEIGGVVRNVLYVATMENWLYAFDADGGHRDPNGIPQPLWSLPLGPPLPVNRIPKDIGATLGKYNVEPYIGVTSTPVIDRGDGSGKGTIFLVAKIAKVTADQVDCDKQPSTRECPIENRIFAIDIQTGAIRDSKPIELPAPDGPGHACAIDPNGPVTTPTDAGRINMQRPALLLTWSTDHKVAHLYLGFGSHQDAPCPLYHGMIVRFDYDGTSLAQFNPGKPFLVTQGGDTNAGLLTDITKLGKGGIWQAGNGPAADSDGNIYVMTGNGSFEKDRQFGCTFLKLSPDFSKVDWFAPANVKDLDSDVLDIDLGSAGPVLLGSNEIVGGGKQGRLYLLDRSQLGNQQQRSWFRDHTNPPIQFFWAAHRWSVSYLYGWFPISLILPAFATGYHHIHGSPAFWGDSMTDLRQGSLYVWPERDRVKSFSYSKAPGAPNGKFDPKPKKAATEAGVGMPGGFLSISASSDDGILWASIPLHDDAWIDIVRGSLHAFHIKRDGSVLDPIWTSYCADKDDRFNFGKNVPPTVVNGNVYLATFSGFIAVYGLRAPGHSGRDALAACSVSDFMMMPSPKKTHQAAQGHK